MKTYNSEDSSDCSCKDLSSARPANVTIGEASYVTQRSISFVNEVLSQYFIKHKVLRKKNGWVHKFGLPELRFISISQEVKKDLTSAAYCRVYTGLRKLPASAHCLVTGVICFDIAQADQLISDRLDRLLMIKDIGNVSQSGEVTFRNTGISILEVAKTYRLKDIEFVKSLYPVLGHEDVNLINEFVRLYPDAEYNN